MRQGGSINVILIRKFQQIVYVADITKPCILGLDILQFLTLPWTRSRTSHGQEERKFICLQTVNSIAKEPLTKIQMLSLEYPLLRASKITRKPTSSCEWERIFL
ncbi:hypothetical protein AVEN_173101-1 [Araneus ventricosus]|uniref:Uncharacterized protein n=1 Tax=Araneus ventricosus TaxID=182803 RepID=A0A4Y2FPU7_ARAVE|nr:hypothetical protein AVEN_173101-1 [Araneus ventricosus]